MTPADEAESPNREHMTLKHMRSEQPKETRDLAQQWNTYPNVSKIA